MSNKGKAEGNSHGLLLTDKNMRGAMSRLISIIRQEIGAFWTIHWFLRFGILVFTISAALDLFYHVGSSFWSGNLDVFLGPDGYYTHIALFIGMVLVVSGVIFTRSQPSSQAVPVIAEKVIERR